MTTICLQLLIHSPVCLLHVKYGLYHTVENREGFLSYSNSLRVQSQGSYNKSQLKCHPSRLKSMPASMDCVLIRSVLGLCCRARPTPRKCSHCASYNWRQGASMLQDPTWSMKNLATEVERPVRVGCQDLYDIGSQLIHYSMDNRLAEVEVHIPIYTISYNITYIYMHT